MVSHFLADFFDGSVQIADVGNRLADHLAVGFDHEAQDAVGAGMLRSHADGHVFGIETARCLCCFAHNDSTAAVFRPAARAAC